jgi:fibronectin-binding autotransporter adhesin
MDVTMLMKFLRSLRSRKRFQNYRRHTKRAFLVGLLVAGLHTSASAQDVNNTTTVNVITNGGVSAVGNYNNTATGTINFNGPNGASPFVAGGGSITNAGNINVNFADVGITGNITNQSSGKFTLGLDAGSVGVNGNWINNGASQLQLNGGSVLVRGDLTNNSTSTLGIDINSGRSLTADNITNSSGSTIVSAGTINISTRTTTGVLTNAGTLTSTGTLNGKLINNGTVNAEGSKLGTTTNSATKNFNVTGSLTANNTFANAGALNLNGGNFMGITTLTNTSAITIGDGYTLGATTANNDAGGTINVGEGSTLQSTTLNNKATINVDAEGMILNTGKITNDTDGVINFDGPTGTSKLSSSNSLDIENKGAINLNAGTIQIKGNVTGAGSISIADGTTLQSGNAAQTFAQGVSIAGTSTWDTNGFNNEASGVVSGTGGLTKVGLGSLKLSGANTYTGTTKIDAGEVIASGGSAIANTGAVNVGALGTFRVASAETIGSLEGAVGSQTVLATNLTTGGASNTTYSGNLTGAGKLIKQGAGTFTLNSATANTYSGGTDINAGNLQASGDNVLGTGAVKVAGDATLDVASGKTQSIASLQIAGAVVGPPPDNTSINGNGIVDNNGTITSTARVDNSGVFNNKIAASVVNGGFDNKTGATLNNTGTVNGRVDNDGTLNSNTATSIITGGLNNTATANVQNSVTGAITNSGTGVMTVTGELAGNNTVVNSGTGRIVVDGGNFTGSTSITNNSTDASGLEVKTSRTLSTGALTNASGSTVDNSGTITSTARVNNNGTFNNVLVDSIVNGGFNNNADATLNNTGTVNGGVTNGGTLNSNTATSVINGGLINTAYANVQNSISGAITNSGEMTVTGNLVGDNSVTNSAGGFLDLNNGNFTGITTLNNMGDISTNDYRLSADSITNTADGSIYVAADGSLESNSTIQNSGSISAEAASQVYADGTITNSSTGTMVFNAVPKHSTPSTGASYLTSDNNTIVNNGSIQVLAGSTEVQGNVSGSGQIKLDNGAAWLQGNQEQTIANQVNLNSGYATFDSNVKTTATISGSVQGTGGLTKLGTGNLNLSGNNSFAGAAVVGQGQLQLSGGNAISNSSGVFVGDFATLRVSNAETLGYLSGNFGAQTVLDADLTTGAANVDNTYRGSISGSGKFIKIGTGTQTLSSTTANTHTGGTTVGAGTLVAGTSNQLGTGALNVATGATLTTGANSSQTVASATNAGTTNIGSGATLRGTSGVTNSGTGTVNVGTGGQITSGTSIANSGTMNFNGGSTALRSDTNQINNTGRINLNSGVLTVKGNLLGTGLIAMTNGTTLRSDTANQQIDNNISVASGIASLDSNGNNIAVNGTVAGAGTLNKIGAGTVTWKGSNSGLTTINAGTLTTSTGNIGGNVQTGNGTTLNLNQTSNGTYNGIVSGNGQLIKDGAAITTLTGNSTYSGGTIVREGTLRVGQTGTGRIQSNVQVNQNATLGGGGTIGGNVNVSQGGRIAAGNSIGTLNIAGNLNASGSTVENELSPTQSDQVNVTGTANIAGAALQNVFTPTAGYTTRMFRILDATGGVNGRFASVTNTNEPSNQLVSTYYTPTTANVVLTAKSDAILAPSTRLAMLTNAQDTLSILVNQASMTQLHYGAGNAQQPLGRRLWFRGLGQFDNVASRDQLAGYQANSGGGMVGWDQQIGDQSLAGLAFSYTDTDLAMRNDARATSKIGTPRISLYSVTGFGDAAWTNVVGYGYQDMKLNRNLLGVGTAESSHSGNEFTLASQVSYRLSDLTPFAGIQWASLNENNFSEHGTPGFDLSVAKSSTSSLRPYVGMGYQHMFGNGAGRFFAPQIFARYSYEAISDSNVSNIDINGSSFRITSVRPNQHLAGLGGGFNGQWSPVLDYFTNYRIDLGDRGTSQSVSGGIGFRF